MAILGLKMSAFLCLLSVWGIIQLAAMGGLLKIKSVAFVEDFEAEGGNSTGTIDDLYASYEHAASNCWIACGIYGVTLIFSAWQWYANSSSN